MLLSKAAEYAIRAMIYLGTDPPRTRFRNIKEISNTLDISFQFMTKIFQTLAQAGLVESAKGPRGGVALLKVADAISLMDIFLAVDGERLFTQCCLGLKECSDQRPCPVHSRWVGARDGIENMFRATRLDWLAEQLKKKGKIDLNAILISRAKPA